MPAPQTVTVLFTDLVDSTELFGTVEPERAEEIRRDHFSLLRGAVSAAGGNEVKSLGDGLMVTFSSLSRALACAVGMQQGIERRNRRAIEPISIRIGLSTGEAIQEDGDYFGDPVVEASRLCTHARGGQILTTETARVMAGRHATQEFASLGHTALKGLPEPVHIVEVRWAPVPEADQAAERLTLPTRLVATSSESLFAFFGRAEELEALAAVHKRAATEGHPGIVLISGEPGVGKTSLVAQAARAAYGVGTSVVYGACDEDLAVPYRPWLEALTPLVDSLPIEVIRNFAEGSGLALARLLPDLARRLEQEIPSDGADSDSERFMVMEGMVRLLGAASEETPLLVVLDDLQWADAASLQTLRHLVHSSPSMSMMVICTFRESELSRSHPLTALLADMRREPAVQRLGLSGLEDFEIIGLMEAAAGHALPEDGVGLAHALRRETGGNPFFVVELLRHLAANGTLAEGEDGLWHLTTELDDLGLPGSVREVVAHRVASLGEEAEQALSMAAVIGQDFDLAVLGSLLAPDESTLIDLLERCVSTGILIEAPGQADRYRFTHALVEHTLYQDLSAARRQRAHHKVAEVLEQTDSDDPERVALLARHWLAATRPADASKALYYARRAGEAALASYAPADAVRWFEEALEVLGPKTNADEHERCALLVDLGTAQHQAGMPGHRESLLQAAALAQQLDDTDHLVAAALGSRRGFGSSALTDPERTQVLEAARSSFEEGDAGTRALLLTSLAEATDARNWRRRRELADEAQAVAQGIQDPAVKLDVLLSCYYFRVQPESSEERLANSAEAMAIAERLADPWLRFRACYHRLHACLEAAKFTEIDGLVDEMRSLAARTGLPWCKWTLLITESWRLLLTGDTAGAERLNDEAAAIATSIGEPSALAQYGGILLAIRREQGRMEEVIELLVQAVAANPAIPATRAALASTYCSLERFGEARQLLGDDAISSFADMPRDIIWTTSMVRAQEIAVGLRDLKLAEFAYRQLSPHAHLVAFNLGATVGSLARPLGCLARFLDRNDEAQSHFRRALSVNERLRSPFWMTQTQLDYAELLFDLKSSDEGRDLSRQALATSQRFGYRRLENKAEDLLNSSA